MWACESWEIVFASRSNRCRTSGEAERCCGSTLIATERSSRVSFARYTSPIPPAPRGPWISYGPKRVPAARVIAPLLSQIRHPVQDDVGRRDRVAGRCGDEEEALAVARGDVAVAHGAHVEAAREE